MSQFDENELNNLMTLCRINCTAEEKAQLRGNLHKILSYMELLNEADTEGVEPCARVLETVKNVMREDLPADLLPRERFLALAPAHVGGMIRVPPVIKFSNP